MDLPQLLSCPECGYDLSGHPDRLPLCPECGYQLNEPDLSWPARVRRLRLTRMWWSFIAAPYVTIAAAAAVVYFGDPVPFALLLLLIGGSVMTSLAVHGMYLESPDRGAPRVIGSLVSGVVLTCVWGLMSIGVVVGLYLLVAAILW